MESYRQPGPRTHDLTFRKKYTAENRKRHDFELTIVRKIYSGLDGGDGESFRWSNDPPGAKKTVDELRTNPSQRMGVALSEKPIPICWKRW